MANKLLRGAYTDEPSVTGKGWSITFCDYFFKGTDKNPIRSLTDITKGEKSKQLNSLISHEHLLSHEFMHVKLFGHKYKIEDIDEINLAGSTGTKTKVYGVSRCQEWAK